MSATFESWREHLGRPTCFEGITASVAVKAAHKASGISTPADFNAWLDAHGLKPFNTGRSWVLIVPRGSGRKLTARPIPSDGSETY